MALGIMTGAGDEFGAIIGAFAVINGADEVIGIGDLPSAPCSGKPGRTEW
jgi:hypothetical protein